MRLGFFGLLPREIRDKIFELAIEADKPLDFRGCCGRFSKDLVEPGNCPFHNHRYRYPHIWPSRFALLWTSRTLSKEIQNTIYSKVTLRITADPETVMPQPQSLPRKEDENWMIAARFRHLEITVHPIGIRNEAFTTYTAALGALVDKVLFFADGRSPSWPADNIKRQVTLNLGRIFEERLPFNVSLASYAGGQEPYPPLFVLRRLDEVIQLISRLEPAADITIAAMTQLSTGKDRGRSYLDGLRRWVEERGMGFEEKTRTECPQPQYVESYSALGARHLHFV
ncbi:hypothetical protein DM02DRAFT_661715 [Periconia macrospinosa]|uniref:F-box domain-containing protein n=1 Tax=Periconia macrospinosa TaxID=97972 RepID=A0A2V1D6H1_9PLEO|nr:hypothetical protein DM02DRAFT_661715 [Periconia macrospinosa]